MADKEPKIYPIVLSGGSGSRLWPLSREQYPKQMLAPLGGRTLLQETCVRLGDQYPVQAPLVVCNEEHRFLVAEQLRGRGPKARIVLEPMGRNTAPALTCAALLLAEADPAGVLVVMAADHVVTDNGAFQAAVRAAAVRAAAGAIVALGVEPERPETGYGYIKEGRGGRIEAFVEKPDQDRAEGYVASGEYLWNSGIFVLEARVWLEEVQRYAPAILDACRVACLEGRQDGDFFRLGREGFEACPSDSIDYAVMEHTELGYVERLDAGWSDIGAWSSLWQQAVRDLDGNVLEGDVVAQDTHNSLVLAQSRLVTTIGVEDLVVVETADAVLVVPRARVQEVKALVQRLSALGREECKHQRRVHRPWGSYETIDSGADFQVKHLVVNPGAALSLQLHYHRAEHWVVVRGAAKVTRGEEEFVLTENQSTYIPIGVRHRLENPGTIALELIEVQSGQYLGEDDIVRFEDVYLRHAF